MNSGLIIRYFSSMSLVVLPWIPSSGGQSRFPTAKKRLRLDRLGRD
jgi:hypothetical protein